MLKLQGQGGCCMAKQGRSVEASLQRFEQGRHWWCRGGSGCLKSSSDSGSDWRNQTAECSSDWDSFPMIPLSLRKCRSTLWTPQPGDKTKKYTVTQASFKRPLYLQRIAYDNTIVIPQHTLPLQDGTKKITGRSLPRLPDI